MPTPNFADKTIWTGANVNIFPADNAKPQTWQYRLSALLTAPQEGQPYGFRLPLLTQKLAAPQFGQLLVPVAEGLPALSPSEP